MTQRFYLITDLGILRRPKKSYNSLNRLLSVSTNSQKRTKNQLSDCNLKTSLRILKLSFLMKEENFTMKVLAKRLSTNGINSQKKKNKRRKSRMMKLIKLARVSSKL
jgi:hypothetical protein